jgi:hypothetical protein
MVTFLRCVFLVHVVTSVWVAISVAQTKPWAVRAFEPPPSRSWRESLRRIREPRRQLQTFGLDGGASLHICHGNRMRDFVPNCDACYVRMGASDSLACFTGNDLLGPSLQSERVACREISVVSAGGNVRTKFLHLGVLYLVGTLLCGACVIMFFGSFLSSLTVVATCFSGVATTWMIFCAVGEPLTPLALAATFIVSGIAMDDAFVLTAHAKTDAFPHGVRSVSVTTAVDCAAFLVNGMSATGDLASVSFFAAASLFVVFVLLLFYFPLYGHTAHRSFGRLPRSKHMHTAMAFAVMASALSCVWNKPVVDEMIDFHIDKDVDDLIRCVRVRRVDEVFVVLGTSDRYLEQAGHLRDVLHDTARVHDYIVSDLNASSGGVELYEMHALVQIRDRSWSQRDVDVTNAFLKTLSSDAVLVSDLSVELSSRQEMIEYSIHGFLIIFTIACLSLMFMSRTPLWSFLMLCSVVVITIGSYVAFVASSFGLPEAVCITLSSTLALDYVMHASLCRSGHDTNLSSALICSALSTICYNIAGIFSEIELFSRFSLLTTFFVTSSLLVSLYMMSVTGEFNSMIELQPTATQQHLPGSDPHDR